MKVALLAPAFATMPLRYESNRQIVGRLPVPSGVDADAGGMTAAVPPATPTQAREGDDPLAAAQAALQAGHTDSARELAQGVLADARGQLPQVEARALSLLAHCDRLGSRQRRAADAARRSAQLFEELGDVRGETGALITLAQVSMLLGRNDEAVEAALLAVRLCEMQAVHPQSVLAYNALGLAYSWSGDHDRADVAFEKAVAAAERCEPPVSLYQPRLNQSWVEASRLVDERYEIGRLGDRARLRCLAEECWALEASGQGWHVLPGMAAMGRAISRATKGLLAAWDGLLHEAQAEIDEATRALPADTSWLHAFVRWCAAELAWAQGDGARAEAEMAAMLEIALSVEHEQLACRAHLLRAQLFEQQGRHDAAAQEYRALRRRERRVRAEGLGTRESLVSWRLDARLSQRRLEQAMVAARQFERWSLEDALTGLANRRQFEQTLAQRLAARVATGQQLAVAMIDVDRFKSVNDCYTHRVGDRVLKTVAALLAAQVREADLPARWAGDEFVVLFVQSADAASPAGLDLCERIAAAVAAFEWEAIAPGLAVTVSVGVAGVLDGDSGESAVHRADEAMYRVKSQRPASA
jgi:diguanylate cyclase (GGDEF)-like protein